MNDLLYKSIKYIFYNYYRDFGRNSTYIINALHSNNIYCIGELIELSEKEFKRLDRIGIKTFTVIDTFLVKNNLSFRKE